jgi:hypothetical protein
MESKKLLRDVAEGLVTLTLIKVASRFAAPLAVIGVGYFLYQKFVAKPSVWVKYSEQISFTLTL